MILQPFEVAGEDTSRTSKSRELSVSAWRSPGGTTKASPAVNDSAPRPSHSSTAAPCRTKPKERSASWRRKSGSDSSHRRRTRAPANTTSRFLNAGVTRLESRKRRRLPPCERRLMTDETLPGELAIRQHHPCWQGHVFVGARLIVSPDTRPRPLASRARIREPGVGCAAAAEHSLPRAAETAGPWSSYTTLIQPRQQ